MLSFLNARKKAAANDNADTSLTTLTATGGQNHSLVVSVPSLSTTTVSTPTSTASLCQYNTKHNKTVLDALAASKRCFKPAFSAENTTALMTAVSVAADGYNIATGVSTDPQETTATTAAAIINSTVSGIAANKALYERIRNLQTAQETLIKMVAPNAVSCIYKKNDEEIAIDRPRNNADQMIRALREHGNLSVELDIPDFSVSVTYPSVVSTRSVLTFVANFVPAVALGAAETARKLGNPLDSTEHLAVAFIAGSSPGKGLDKVWETFNGDTKDLLRDYCRVVTEIFVLPNRLHAMTEDEIRPFVPYIGEESATIIREAVSAAQKEVRGVPDLEDGETTRLTGQSTLRLTGMV